MSAADLLKQKNGLKTTQSVLQKQQSGEDAAQKQTAEQMNMNTAKAMLQGKENTLTPPKDEHEAAVRMNQQTAEGLMHNTSIPIVKKSEPEKVAAPGNEKKEAQRGMSYADMFKMINPEGKAKNENDEKRERTRMRIAAIGDGLRALSNIYFATKGAKVIHNPEQDLTGTMLKRKQMMDAQREKNRSAWINGYQRALALDEEARKNDRTISEQIRHNKELEAVAKQKANQGDTRLEQSQQRLDLSKMKYESDKDYKESLLKLKQAVAAGTIEYHQAMATAAKMRAARSGRSQATKEDFDEAYMDIQGRDKEGLDKASEQVAKSGINPTTTAGRKQTVKTYRKNNSKKPAAKTSAKSKFSIHK